MVPGSNKLCRGLDGIPIGHSYSELMRLGTKKDRAARGKELVSTFNNLCEALEVLNANNGQTSRILSAYGHVSNAIHSMLDEEPDLFVREDFEDLFAEYNRQDGGKDEMSLGDLFLWHYSCTGEFAPIVWKDPKPEEREDVIRKHKLSEGMVKTIKTSETMICIDKRTMKALVDRELAKYRILYHDSQKGDVCSDHSGELTGLGLQVRKALLSV